MTYALCLSHRYIQQQFSTCAVQDLDQVANALLPDVEGMLPGRASHYVLSIARETAPFPWCPE